MKSNTAADNAMIMRAKALLGISLEDQVEQKKKSRPKPKSNSSALLKRTKSSEFCSRETQASLFNQPLKSNLENF